jgi:hypothetical protein
MGCRNWSNRAMKKKLIQRSVSVKQISIQWDCPFMHEGFNFIPRTCLAWLPSQTATMFTSTSGANIHPVRLSLYARGRTCLAWLPSQTATMFTSTTSPVSSQDTQCRAVTTKLHKHINNQPFFFKETVIMHVYITTTKYRSWTLPLQVPLSDNYRT